MSTTSDDEWGDEPPAQPSRAARQRVAPSKPAETPALIRPAGDQESYLLGCCVLDEGHTLDRCITAGLTSSDFTTPAHAVIFSALRALRSSQTPIALDTLVEHLGPRVSEAGGIEALMALDQIGTTARASHALKQVLDASERRRLQRITAEVQEGIAQGRDLDELQALLERAKRVQKTETAAHRTPFSFSIPSPKDPSILLGNRYLNRGDGLVLSSSSGMGKSSMSHQMAADWALGLPFHGIAPNGPLKILIVQSEDSDGDIAEVWQSLKHVKRWTPAQLATLEQNIRIISERALRGVKFLNWLKAEISAFAPDLVMLNPLQAFIDGDVTDSKDLGFFLREGLNGINREGKFGYLIVHHTTKPATGKDKHERQWHEVMYDMAGGAEIINWARGIISLRPTSTEGVFKLVLAKRGRRAGITKAVQQGAGTRLEPITQIGLKHAQGHIPGTGAGLICWEAAELEEGDQSDAKKLGGRPEKYPFADFASILPGPGDKPLAYGECNRILVSNGMTRGAVQSSLKRWTEAGDLECHREDGQPIKWRRAF